MRFFSNRASHEKEKPLQWWLLLLIDLLCIAALLLSFAYFHHVRPKELIGGSQIGGPGYVDDNGTPDFKPKRTYLLANANNASIGETLSFALSLDTTDTLKKGTVYVEFQQDLLTYLPAVESDGAGDPRFEISLSETEDSNIARLTVDIKEGEALETGDLITLAFTVNSDISKLEDAVWIVQEETVLYNTTEAITILYDASQDPFLPTGDEDVIFTVDAPSVEAGEQYSVLISAESQKDVCKGTVTVIYNNVRLSYFYGAAFDAIDGDSFTITNVDNGNNTGTLTITFENEEDAPIGDNDLFILLFTANVALEGYTPISVNATLSDATSAVTTPTESKVFGDFRDLYPEQFSTDGIEIDNENEFKSEKVHITWREIRDTTTWGKTVDYYVADIYIREPELLKSYIHLNSSNQMKSAKVDYMAKKVDSILAINGDYCSYRQAGIILRNGILYRDQKSSLDLLFMYADGTMATFSPEEANAMNIPEMNLLNVWYFGPMLLKDGEPMTKFNSNVTRDNPRSAIGYYAPGHYVFVCVDGRGVSEGLDMTELSQLFKDLGCTVAYNLDGGQSSVLTWNGDVINTPCNGDGIGRSISDILYIPRE